MCGLAEVLRSASTRPGHALVVAEDPTAAADELARSGIAVTPLAIHAASTWVQRPTRLRHGLRATTLPARQGLPAAPDAILFLGFGPGDHPLLFFQQAAAILAPNGLVALAPVVQESAARPRLSHWLAYADAIAARCGFECVPAPAADARPPWHLYRPATPPRWALRHAGEAEFDGVASLFRETFDQELSPALWRWKYGDGRGNAVVVRHESRSVAHYGGIYRDVLLAGEPDWALQICDVMVQTRERAVLTRHGPFFLAAATAAEMYGPLGFGFPNRRAMQVGERLGLYKEVDRMVEIRWTPAATRPRVRTTLRPIDEATLEEGRAAAERLWPAMAADLSGTTVAVRDWDHLRHRYLEHPHNRYTMVAVHERLTSRPVGLMVLRPADGSCELLDVVGPLRAVGTLVDQARRLTAQWGLRDLYCWISASQKHAFLRTGGAERDLDISVPSSSWTGEPRADRMGVGWWMMSGDTDFH